MKKIYFKVWRLPWRSLVVGIFLLTFLYSGVVYYAAKANTAELEAMSWAVAQRVIVVDPGHGGRDPGAIGSSGLLEKDITLAVAKNLTRSLRQAGATVILTRETDIDLVQAGQGTLKKRDLDARLGIVGKNKADLYVSIQANALASRRWRGAQTFYFSENAEGKKLAQAIQGQLISIMGNTDRKILPSDTTYMLKKLEIPAALVEVGFLSNPSEEKLLADPDYQDKLAFAIYAGIANYMAGEIHAVKE